MTKTTIALAAITAALMAPILFLNTAQATEADSPENTPTDAKRLIANFGGRVTLNPDNQDHCGGPVPERVVSFANSNLTDDDLLRLTGAIAAIFQQCPVRCSNKLDLSYTKVTGKGFRKLQEITNLTELDLSSTLLCDEGLLELTYLTSLLDIDLDYTRFSISVLKQLVMAFSQRPILLSLKRATVVDDELSISPALTDCRPKRASAARVLEVVRLLRGVQGLDLSYLGINDADLNGFFTPAMEQNLRWIDLSYNQLSNDCLSRVVRLRRLWFLRLSGNSKLKSIDNSDVKSIELLRHLKCLKELYLSSTGITNNGLKALNLSTLDVLDISDTRTLLNAEVLRPHVIGAASVAGTVLLGRWDPPIPVAIAIPVAVALLLEAWRPIKLTELYISKTGIGDRELSDPRMTAYLINLTDLDIKDTIVNPQTLETLTNLRISLSLLAPNGKPPDLTIYYSTWTEALKARIRSLLRNVSVVSKARPLKQKR